MTKRISFAAQYITGDSVFDGYRDDLMAGIPPIRYPVGDGPLSRIEIGPGLVTLFGGAPGSGKTAFVMQCITDAMRLTSTLKVLVCNIEMSPAVLLDRQLSRLSNIPLTTIRNRQFADDQAVRIGDGLEELEAILDRLCFIRSPFDLENVAASADAFGADVIVLDYIQRIRAPGEHGDKRGNVDATMNYIRQFADAGVAVIVVAAVSRQKDSKGRSSYDGDAMSLASFRESSELEFGADSAFILAPEPKTDRIVILKHLKDRHGETKDIELFFNRYVQRFEATTTDDSASSLRGDSSSPVLQQELEGMWEPEL